MKENTLIIVIVVIIILLIVGVVGVMVFINSEDSNTISLAINNSTDDIDKNLNNSVDYSKNSNHDLCSMCGKPLKKGTDVHTDGTKHSDDEWEDWYVKQHEVKPGVYVGDDGSITYSNSKNSKKSGNSKTSSSKKNNKKTPNEEPIPK